jgi:hypothetical protein
LYNRFPGIVIFVGDAEFITDMFHFFHRVLFQCLEIFVQLLMCIPYNRNLGLQTFCQFQYIPRHLRQEIPSGKNGKVDWVAGLLVFDEFYREMEEIDQMDVFGTWARSVDELWMKAVDSPALTDWVR